MAILSVKRVLVAALMLCSFLNGTAAGKAQNKPLSTRTLRTMARAYMAYGQYDKARPLAERAVAQAQRDAVEIGEKALCLIDLGTLYSEEQMLEDAAAMLSSGVVLQRQAIGVAHPYTAHTLRMLSDVYRRQGDLAAAEAMLAEAFSVMLAHTQIQSRQMTPYVHAAAQLAAAQGRHEAARMTYQTALQMALASYGAAHLYTARIIQGAAEAALACGDMDAARSQIDQAVAIQERTLAGSPVLLIDGWLAKARIERTCGAMSASEQYLQKAAAAAQHGRNAITIARVYRDINAIRAETVYTAMAQR